MQDETHHSLSAADSERMNTAVLNIIISEKKKAIKIDNSNVCGCSVLAKTVCVSEKYFPVDNADVYNLANRA